MLLSDNIPMFHRGKIYNHRIITYPRTTAISIKSATIIARQMCGCKLLAGPYTKGSKSHYSLHDCKCDGVLLHAAYHNPVCVKRVCKADIVSLRQHPSVLCMGSFSPLQMQEGSTNKICDWGATARCRRDEAAYAGQKGMPLLHFLRVSETKILAIWRNASTSFNRYTLGFVG